MPIYSERVSPPAKKEMTYYSEGTGSLLLSVDLCEERKKTFDFQYSTSIVYHNGIFPKRNKENTLLLGRNMIPSAIPPIFGDKKTSHVQCYSPFFEFSAKKKEARKPQKALPIPGGNRVYVSNIGVQHHKHGTTPKGGYRSPYFVLQPHASHR